MPYTGRYLTLAELGLMGSYKSCRERPASGSLGPRSSARLGVGDPRMGCPDKGRLLVRYASSSLLRVLPDVFLSSAGDLSRYGQLTSPCYQCSSGC